MGIIAEKAKSKRKIILASFAAILYTLTIAQSKVSAGKDDETNNNTTSYATTSVACANQAIQSFKNAYDTYCKIYNYLRKVAMGTDARGTLNEINAKVFTQANVVVIDFDVESCNESFIDIKNNIIGNKIYEIGSEECVKALEKRTQIIEEQTRELQKLLEKVDDSNTILLKLESQEIRNLLYKIPSSGENIKLEGKILYFVTRAILKFQDAFCNVTDILRYFNMQTRNACDIVMKKAVDNLARAIGFSAIAYGNNCYEWFALFNEVCDIERSTVPIYIKYNKAYEAIYDTITTSKSCNFDINRKFIIGSAGYFENLIKVLKKEIERLLNILNQLKKNLPNTEQASSSSSSSNQH